MTVESPEVRSRTMRAVKSQNTTPEKIIRQLVSGWGLRYRLNRKDLVGKPDLVFSKLKKSFPCMAAFGMATGVSAAIECLKATAPIGR